MAALVKMGTDSRGNYQRDLGWKDVDGKLRQQRFYLGKDRAQATIRYVLLDSCWAAVERRWNRQPADNRPIRPLWDSVTLLIGQALARGDEQALIDPAEHFKASVGQPHEEPGVDGLVQTTTVPAEMVDPTALLSWINQLQTDFPFVRLQQAGDWPRAARAKVQDTAKTFKAFGQQLERLAVGGQTLHQALDAFKLALSQKYQTIDRKVSQFGQAAQRQVQCIKEHAENVPLEVFGLNQIEAIIDHWRNRPTSKRGKPVAVDTVKNTIKRFRAFLRWLHRSPDFDWRKPEDYEVLPIRVQRTPAEKAKRFGPQQVATYNVDELSVLWEQATPKERVFIVLALNCGFGMGELGTLQAAEVFLNQPHGHYPLEGSFIKRCRNKTDVYGEWQLWPETVAALQWYKAQRPATSETALLVTRNGRSYTKETEGNNRNNQIANAWNKLIRRVRKDHEGFRHLSFNKLRKTAGDMVKRAADGETAGVFHCRGQAVVSDDLSDIYTNRHFDKVFTALQRVRERLAPMFTTLADPFPPDHKKSNPSLPLSVRRKIVELREQGHKYKAIAAELGVSIETIRRYLRKAGV